jgi:DNA mismatch endonuclease (patch repair protein)
MISNRSRDTKPEMAVRRLLHQAGLRYRIGIRPVPDLRRTADIVFTRARVAVFIDGCFWHGCPDHHTQAKEMPITGHAKLAQTAPETEIRMTV